VSHPGSPEGHRSAFGHTSRVWVAKVLVGDIVGAAMLAPTIQAAGFNLYTTRDIDVAKYCVRSLYEDDEDARYAWHQTRIDHSRDSADETTTQFRRNSRTTLVRDLSIRQTLAGLVDGWMMPRLPSVGGGWKWIFRLSAGWRPGGTALNGQYKTHANRKKAIRTAS
jgi:hypothetical protein